MIDVKIHSSKVNAGAASIVASIYHGRNEKFEAGDIHSAFQKQTKNKMMALSGSFTVLDQGPQRTLVRGILVPTRDVIPFNSNTQGFKSLSASIYSDDSDNIWRLSKSANGQVLIRAGQIEDPAEIQAMMQSCSSAIKPGSDNLFFTSISKVNKVETNFEVNDAITYQHDGELRFGVVAEHVSASNDQGAEVDALAVYCPETETLDIVDPSMVAVASNITEHEGLTIPETLSFTATASDSNYADTLVNYYKQVYGFNAEFFAELEKRIRSHAFA